MSVDALRSLGYNVVQASDEEQALAALAAQPRADAVRRHNDAGMNGRQLADAARRQCADLKVLFTTGYTCNAVVHNGVLDPGVVFIFSKPFGVDQLALKVRQVLDGIGDNRPAEGPDPLLQKARARPPARSGSYASNPSLLIEALSWYQRFIEAGSMLT